MENSTTKTNKLTDEPDVHSHSTLCDCILHFFIAILSYFGFNHRGRYRPTPDEPEEESEYFRGHAPPPPPWSTGGGGQTD
ncbi:hypothetical protein SDJN02_13168 [Cucurbita argyrosperma subsp. argyrosperma]|nr:hypothetical protein SDJN02_13168 [Cucurbita argyrosperma subsp. argyrosperma]